MKISYKIINNKLKTLCSYVGKSAGVMVGSYLCTICCEYFISIDRKIKEVFCDYNNKENK